MPRLPFPATSGRKTSLYHYCRILSEELGYRLIVAAFLEKGDDPQLNQNLLTDWKYCQNHQQRQKLKIFLWILYY